MKQPLTRAYILILMGAAILFDALGTVPGAGEFVSPVGQAVMAFLFYRAGINVFKHKKLLVFVFTTVFEIIPAASALPFFLAETMVLIALARAKKE